MDKTELQPIGHSVGDAVAITGSSRTVLYNAMKAGHLRAKKLGARRIILDADLRAWMASLPDASSKA